MSRDPLALLLGLLLLLSACGDDPVEEDPAPRSPNVLLLVMDATRGDRCSVNGYPRPTTPCLEKIAAEGVLYRNAWSPGNWTGPTHATLFTGLRPDNHGLYRGNRLTLNEASVTLAERFRGAGYRTACLSNNNTLSAEFGLIQGFDLVVPLFRARERAYPWAEVTHRAALEWALEVEKRGERFFLVINDMEPHFPYTPPAEFAARFRSSATPPEAMARARALSYASIFGHNAGVEALSPDVLAAIGDLYDAEIACLDASIGRLVDGFRTAGILDETVIVITSDHGENLGDHGLVDHMFSLHRSIRHVPLVVRYPGRFAPGLVIDDPVRLEDIAPTLLEISGLDVPSDLDGRSLLSRLPGRVALAVAGAPGLFLDRMVKENPGRFDDAPLRADIRARFDGRHHTIRYSDGRTERYDVVTDPGERVDLGDE